MNSFTLQKAYTLYVQLTRLITHWPKRERYNLGGRLETTSLLLLENIITAEQTVPVMKDRALLEASIKSEILKLLLRIAMEQQLMKETNYFTMSQQVLEIGKMIGGWRKSLQK